MSGWCHRLTIFHVFCSQKWPKKRNPYFSYNKTGLISTMMNKCRIMFALIYFDMETCFYMLEQKWKFSKFYIQLTWTIVRRWDHQLTHLHIYIDCLEMFRWKFKNSYLPYLLSDLHHIFTVLFEMFYSFYWINLNLDWIFPLNGRNDYPFEHECSSEI